MSVLPVDYRPRTHEGTARPFLVLEGISGIGKSTLTRLLTHRMSAEQLHTLPQPHNSWSKVVNDRLAPLPQLAFYLSGLLHAADRVRTARQSSPVIADRYQSSVLACHGAVHHIAIEQVRRLADPFLPYVMQPTITFYLRCSEETLRARLRTKRDIKQDDTDLIAVPGRLKQLLFNFEAIAADDPSAVWIDTDGKTPDQLVRELHLHALECTSA
ncbi:thymidylate kinase [Streptomyces fractus]|uniref:thymidylate kinase n=1 Tax=Streptomyces fractus TaxID=641806 RepID=UPI003CF027EE